MTDALVPLYAYLASAAPAGVVVDFWPRSAEGLDLLRRAGMQVVTMAPEAGAEVMVRADPKALPIRPGSVAALVSTGPLISGDDHHHVLKECRAVLREVGTFAAQVATSSHVSAFEPESAGAATPGELEGRLRRFFPYVMTIAQSPTFYYQLKRAGGRDSIVPGSALSPEADPKGEPVPSHHLFVCSRRHRRWMDELRWPVSFADRERRVRVRFDEIEAALRAAEAEATQQRSLSQRSMTELLSLRDQTRTLSAERQELVSLLEEAERRAAEADHVQNEATRATSRAEALSQRLTRMARALEESEHLVGELQATLATEQSVREQSHALTQARDEEVLALRRRIEEVGNHRADAVRRCDDLSEETTSLRAEVERRRAAEKEATDNAAEAKQQLELLKGRAEDAEQRYDHATHALEQLAVERRKWAGERARIDEQISSQREKNARIRGALEASRQRAAQAEAQLARAEEKLSSQQNDLHAQIELSEHNEAKHQGEQKGHIYRLAELEDEGKRQKEAKRALGQALDQCRVAEIETMQTIESLERKHETAEEQLKEEKAARQAEVSNLRLHAEARLAQAWELGDRLDQAMSKVDNLRNEIEHTRATQFSEGAWAMVSADGPAQEVIPELQKHIERSGKLRRAIIRLAAASIAPPRDSALPLSEKEDKGKPEK